MSKGRVRRLEKVMDGQEDEERRIYVYRPGEEPEPGVRVICTPLPIPRHLWDCDRGDEETP